MPLIICDPRRQPIPLGIPIPENSMQINDGHEINPPAPKQSLWCYIQRWIPPLHGHVIMGSCPFSMEVPLSSPSSPSSMWDGKSFLLCLAVSSAQARKRTRLLIAASRLAFWTVKMALLTLSATVRRSSGCNSAASGGSRLSGGKISSAIVRSRSSKNSLFVGALGANWVLAKVRAGVISPPGVALYIRINSTSCRRRRAKCNDGLLSKTWDWQLAWENARGKIKMMCDWCFAHTEDWSWIIFLITDPKAIWVVHETF